MGRLKKPAEFGQPLNLEAGKIGLKRNSDGYLTISAPGGKTLKKVRVVLGRPLFEPGSFASVLSEKGKEVAMIRDLSRLSKENRRILDRSENEYYLTSRILKVYSLSHQFGAACWDVETDKGRREFVTRGVSEHIRWLDEDRMLIADVDGNRFEIPDLSAMDSKSQSLIHLIL